MRLLRFRCSDCGMEMVLETRPDECFSCGSRKIIREGWRLKARTKCEVRSQEECEQE